MGVKNEHRKAGERHVMEHIQTNLPKWGSKVNFWGTLHG